MILEELLQYGCDRCQDPVGELVHKNSDNERELIRKYRLRNTYGAMLCQDCNDELDNKEDA